MGGVRNSLVRNERKKKGKVLMERVEEGDHVSHPELISSNPC